MPINDPKPEPSKDQEKKSDENDDQTYVAYKKEGAQEYTRVTSEEYADLERKGEV